MCFVSKTGTNTNVLLCNLTVPLIGWSVLELNVFCVEVSSDFLLLNHIGVIMPCVLLEDHLKRPEIL